jgi:SAM-dependent methyltransferase
MRELVSKHYDELYFDYQKAAGEFGGWANAPLFAGYIKPEDTILDFGCGAGWLLMNLHCRRKIGVEVNPSAAEFAIKNGIEVYHAVKDVPDCVADKIISNHALEHTLHPLHELKSLRSKLRQNGRVVFIVPCEGIQNVYKPNDVNHHLYT